MQVRIQKRIETGEKTPAIRHQDGRTTMSMAAASPPEPLEDLTLETRGSVALITLNRPDKLNAWTAAMERSSSPRALASVSSFLFVIVSPPPV